MLIGELAERTGVNPKTIRSYEDAGVLPPPERRLAEVEDRIVELHRIRDELGDLLDRDPAEANPTGCCHLIER